MIETSVIVAALSFGLASSTHCLTMCGGIAIAGIGDSNKLKYSIYYSSGRLLSYSVLGALMGLLGVVLTPTETSVQVARLLSSIMITLMGIYILGWKASLVWLEKMGKIGIWRFIQPHLSGLFPVTSIRKAMTAGALWGLLPCGMVYSALVWSATSGNILSGWLTMLAFGLGTLPAILSLSFLPSLADLMKLRSTKQFLGIAMVLFGLFNGYQNIMSLAVSPIEMPSHQHHH